MKRGAVLLVFLLALAPMSFAQNTSDRATREDINRFLDAMHMRQQMQAMLNTMAVQMKANARQMLQKSMPNAKPQDIAQAEKFIDDALEVPIPVDEYIAIMIPVYQRHFTRSDIDAIVTFYSSPVGQKMMREMPAMMAEAMQAASELSQRHMEQVMARMRARLDEMQKPRPKTSK